MDELVDDLVDDLRENSSWGAVTRPVHVSEHVPPAACRAVAAAAAASAPRTIVRPQHQHPPHPPQQGSTSVHKSNKQHPMIGSIHADDIFGNIELEMGVKLKEINVEIENYRFFWSQFVQSDIFLILCFSL